MVTELTAEEAVEALRKARTAYEKAKGEQSAAREALMRAQQAVDGAMTVAEEAERRLLDLTNPNNEEATW